MESWTIVVLVLALFLIADAQKPCLSKLPGWKGTLYHPQMMKSNSNKEIYTYGEDTNNNCIYYLNTNHATKVKLSIAPKDTFSDSIEEEDATLTISKRDRTTYNWTAVYPMSGNRSFWRDMGHWDDVIVDSPGHLKLVAPKSTTSLIVEYEMITCPEMHRSVKVIACTKDNYYGSQCVLQCADDYHPLDIVDTMFHAHCAKKYVEGETIYYWKFSSKTPEEACISKYDVENKCFAENDEGKCPYTLDDLLELKDELFKRPQKPARQNYLEALLMDNRPRRKLKARCSSRYCSVDWRGAFTLKCGNLKKKRRRTCMACRHSAYSYCSGNTRIAG